MAENTTQTAQEEQKEAAGVTWEESMEDSKQDSKEDSKQDSKQDSRQDSRQEKKSRKEKKDEKNALEQKVAELEEQVARDKDDYLRLRAEFENYRRRTSEEKLNLIRTAGEDTIKGLLGTLDDFERAMTALENATDIASAREGTALIYNKLLGYLKTKGLAVIEAKGETFDTDVHEAVTLFPVQDESLKGKVIDVMQTGYTLGGKVIRYAKVIVGQ